jgi:hypothetical protein
LSKCGFSDLSFGKTRMVAMELAEKFWENDIGD